MAKEGKKPKEQMKGLAALCAITEAISGSLDLDETLNKALEKTMEFLGVEIGAIFLLDDEKRQAKLMVQRGLSEESVQSLNTLQVDERIIKRLTEEAKRGKWVVIFKEVFKRTRLFKDIKAAIDRERLQCYLPILVRSKQDILGGMIVASREAREFTPEQIDLSIAVGRQIGVAIENTRLYQEQRHQLEERKRAEEALRKSEEHYRHIFEHSPVGIGIASPDGKVITANKAMEAITGYSLEELQEINLADTYEYPEDRKALLEAISRNGGVVDFPVRLKRKDGTPYEALLSISRINLGGNDFYHTICQDITERKQAEEALKASEERYRTLFDDVPVGLYRATPEGQNIDANPAALQMLGYPDRESLQAVNVADLYVDPQERSRWQALMEHEGAVLDFETQLRRRDGTVIWVEDNARTVRDADGRVLYYEGSLEEITERKRVEEALRLQSEIAANMAEGVHLTRTSDGVIVYTNPRFEEMFGYGQGELIGKHVSVLNAPGDKSPEETAKEIIESLNENGVWYGEVHNVKKDGTSFWCRASVSTLEDPQHGEIWVAVHEDITERKRAEEALQRLNRQLAALLEIAAGLETTASPTELATNLVHALADRLAYPFVGIWLLEGDVLKRVAEVGYSTKPLLSEFAEIPLEQGVIGRVARTGQPAFVPDVSQDSDFRGLAEIRSEICCPLRGTGGLMGVLDVESCETLTEADFALVQAAARLSATALSNAQLFGASRRQAEELAALYDVSLEVATQLEIEQLLQTILERAIRLLNARGGGIYLYDPAKREIELRASHGYFTKDYIGTRLALGEGLSGKVAETGESLMVNDYQRWEGRSPPWEGEPIGGVLAVPLKRGDDLLGVLTIDHAPGKTFQEGDGRLATLFANQAAIAIDNARLYEQTDEKLRHRVAELTALNAIAQSLTRSLELDEILESIATHVARVMQARICTIRLVEGNELTIGAAVGYRDEASRQHTTKIDERLARIVRDQQPLVVEDLWQAGDIPPSRRMRAKREGVHSFLGVPMISKGETIGVLSIYGEKPHLFSEEEVRLLSTIANQAAMAIEDARLYEKVREHTEELERLVQERTQELQAIHAELLQSTKLAALGQLAAGVAHELNNPLGAISGYLELLQEEVELGPQEMDYMERIEKRIQQSTKIVAELKSLGAPSEPVWQIVNVNDILEETLTLVERRLSFHQIKVQKDITPGLPLMHADPDRLEQVFINLITNARQAMEEGGTLRVASRESRNGEWVEIIFADTGEGIAKEHLNKIFDPFFTTRSPGEGMGLGLSLSHRQIKDHGGAIDVWSEKGRGTVFRVALPPSGAKRCWEILDCDKKERCKAVRENADYRCWSVMEDVSRCKGCEVYRKKALLPLDGTPLPQ